MTHEKPYLWVLPLGTPKSEGPRVQLRRRDPRGAGAALRLGRGRHPLLGLPGRGLRGAAHGEAGVPGGGAENWRKVFPWSEGGMVCILWVLMSFFFFVGLSGSCFLHTLKVPRNVLLQNHGFLGSIGVSAYPPEVF